MSFLFTATNVDYRRCVYESPLAAFLFLFGSTTVENDQISAPTNWGEKDADGDGNVIWQEAATTSMFCCEGFIPSFKVNCLLETIILFALE